MADNDAQVTSGGEGQTTESQTPPSSTNQGGQGDTQADWWSEAQKRGFKSQDEVWKSYRESEKKITEQAENLKQAQKFEQDVEPVIRAIWSDEQLLTQVRDRLQGKETSMPDDKPSTNVKKDGEKQETISAPSSVDMETRRVLQQQLVAEFERENGLDKLDDATKSEVRKIIGSTMGRWVQPGTSPSLQQLRPLLDDAFTVAREQNDKLKSILKDVPPVQDASATMPTMSSSTAPSGEDIRLTPEQEAVAKRMPGGIEGYKEGMRALMK